MSGRTILAATVWCAFVAAASAAFDLTQIDRSVLKEPIYESERPQYCLLVFGPEAKVRVWAVLDGDVLHLDRNGNGDLTDPGDRISPVHVTRRSKERPDIEVIHQFYIHPPANNDAEIAVEPILSCLPDVKAFILEHFVPSDDTSSNPGMESRREKPFRIDVASAPGWEQDANLAFANRPEEAPILHFLGPQQVNWRPKNSLEFRRGETAQLHVGLQTQGLGAVLRASAVPKTARAVAEVEFPAARPGGTPICRRMELKEPGG